MLSLLSFGIELPTKVQRCARLFADEWLPLWLGMFNVAHGWLVELVDLHREEAEGILSE